LFDITLTQTGDVELTGRFDAAQVDNAREVLDRLTVTTSVSFKDLVYISSAGLGVLMATQKRLSEKGQKLKLKNVSGHIREIFKIARFDLIFEIE
jgi:anti-sigma B factor antagonist